MKLQYTRSVSFVRNGDETKKLQLSLSTCLNSGRIILLFLFSITIKLMMVNKNIGLLPLCWGRTEYLVEIALSRRDDPAVTGLASVTPI